MLTCSCKADTHGLILLIHIFKNVVIIALSFIDHSYNIWAPRHTHTCFLRSDFKSDVVFPCTQVKPQCRRRFNLHAGVAVQVFAPASRASAASRPPSLSYITRSNSQVWWEHRSRVTLLSSSSCTQAMILIKWNVVDFHWYFYRGASPAWVFVPCHLL